MSDPLKDLRALLDGVEPSAGFVAATSARIESSRASRRLHVSPWLWCVPAAGAAVAVVAVLTTMTPRTGAPAPDAPRRIAIGPVRPAPSVVEPGVVRPGVVDPSVVEPDPRSTGDTTPFRTRADAMRPRLAARSNASASAPVVLVPAVWNERPGFVAPIEPIAAIDPIGAITPIDLKPISLEPIPTLARIGGGDER